LYTISVNGNVIDSIHVDQNLNSGGWVSLGEYNLQSGVPVVISVINDKTSTEGAVLRADAITFNLIEELTDVNEDDGQILSSFKLYQNYPNPFNPSTTIEYTIPSARKQYEESSSSGIRNQSFNQSTDKMVAVKLKVYDVLGREVAELVNREQKAGIYKVEFDAGQLPSGVYFYTLQAGSFQETKKLMLMK
jgi:hypothetical protein